jgi:hypothetical protein
MTTRSSEIIITFACAIFLAVAAYTIANWTPPELHPEGFATPSQTQELRYGN